jgi:hypothetical protein
MGIEICLGLSEVLGCEEDGMRICVELRGLVIYGVI